MTMDLINYAESVGYNVNTLGDQFFKDMAWGGLMKRMYSKHCHCRNGTELKTE